MLRRFNKRKALVLSAAVAAGLIHAPRGSAALHTWTGATDGLWTTTTNWSDGVVPNATTEDAIFYAPAAGNLSLSTSAAITVHTIQFLATATNPVTITTSNTSTLTIDNSAGDEFTVLAGSHSIVGTNPVTPNIELKLGVGSGRAIGFNIADGATFNIGARINQSNSGNTYTKTGAGTLILSANNGGGTGWNMTGGAGFSVNAGVLVLANGGATGNSGNKFNVNSGGTLEFQANYGSTGSLLTVNDGGTLRSRGGDRAIGAGAGQVVFTSGSGTFDVVENTFTISQDIAGAATINKIGAGTLALNDTSTAASTFTGTVNVIAGTLALSATGSTGASPLINVQSGGAFNVTANSSYAPAANQTLGGVGTVYGAVTLTNTNSTLAPGLVGTVGQLTLGDGTIASPLTLNGGRVHFDLSNDAVTAGANDKLVINGDLNLNGSTRVAINRLNGVLQSTSNYTLMTYTGALNGSTINLVLPIVRQGLSIVDPTTTPGQIQLAVGNGTAADLVWVGDGAANVWEANGAANWNGAADHKYFDWDNVTFDDSGSNSPAVSINGTLVPTSVTINNPTKAYTIGGSGTLTNVNSVTKSGAAAATFNNSGVNLFNALTVNAGALNLAVGNSVGSATVNGGTLAVVQGGTAVFGSSTVNTGGAINVVGAATFSSLNIANGGTLTIGDLAASGTGTLGGSVTSNGLVVFNRPDDYASSTVISGSGNVVKNGAGVATLTANSSYTGTTQVNAGTVHPTVSGAFGSTAAGAGTVTIADGAALDVGNVGTNTLNFGPRVFVVQGNGSGSGVIINNTTNTGTLNQQNAFQKIQLAGDATFGGNMRFDVRANQAGGVNTASLDLAGHTLTKVGNMQFTIVAADVSDGNIVVNQGTLSFETTTKFQGASSVNFSGDSTALQFFANTDPALVTRPFFFNGNSGTIAQASGGTAVLIGSNVILNKSVTIQTAAGTLGHLTLNGNISGSGGITKTGINMLTLAGNNTYTGGTTLAAGGAGTLLTAGTLVTNTNFSNGTLTVNSGVAQVSAKPTSNSASGVTIVPSVQVNGGSIDLTNNALVVDYVAGSSPIDTIKGYITTGYASGSWNGTGIASSSAAAASTTLHPTALGYGEASSLGITSVGTRPVDSDSVVVLYTLAGDANLDTKVNALDFNAVATNFGATGANWQQGDVNYDGNVNPSDFTLLGQNFGGVLSAPALSAALGSVVPEPATLSLLGIAAISVAARRRRV